MFLYSSTKNSLYKNILRSEHHFPHGTNRDQFSSLTILSLLILLAIFQLYLSIHYYQLYCYNYIISYYSYIYNKYLLYISSIIKKNHCIFILGFIISISVFCVICNIFLFEQTALLIQTLITKQAFSTNDY